MEEEQNQLSGAELVNPYEEGKEKGRQVEKMFNSIAPKYDFMNLAMTMGLHKLWREKALDAATDALGKKSQPDSALDVATGTGDVAFSLRRRFPDTVIKGIDISEGMLDIARKKQEKLPANIATGITFEVGDSLNMRFPDRSFSLVTVAYGVRNFQHLEKGLKEMRRVLAPGGVICIIELSCPVSGFPALAYKWYTRYVIPTVGRLVSGDPRAYSYLPESIAAAPQRDDMIRLMRQAGFSSCRWKSLTFGAVTYYIGVAE